MANIFYQVMISSPAQTEQLAHILASLSRKGDTILLQGPLGAGKSVLCRSFIRGVFNDQTMEVPSPSYTLVQHYDHDGKQVVHFDLWRISSEDELYELGWEDMDEAIVLVEWPERLKHFMPQTALHVQISFVDAESRPELRHERVFFSQAEKNQGFEPKKIEPEKEKDHEEGRIFQLKGWEDRNLLETLIRAGMVVEVIENSWQVLC
ncbi:tRNA (adenosine(37)-N6)-threonylcarbamoyltransferase complex ATPase subunit type 1 TsaE [Entomobacter blattae]|uniref:tRNA (adenosine(37)-N6)-threonylcarbamoyltransferase complex ATPase subunit type 1 TsaE n=1 Tax=Entomobacter blattae TaxID=2762277 RepID=UPI00193BC3DD|nr:tRNA (adenosine(37)-N6)-threonylcarbamoyltransferase complex ATPase subunit type 1 TsaE [Entomobacter blattae]